MKKKKRKGRVKDMSDYRVFKAKQPITAIASCGNKLYIVVEDTVYYLTEYGK
jgi:hypothetical protein